MELGFDDADIHDINQSDKDVRHNDADSHHFRRRNSMDVDDADANGELHDHRMSTRSRSPRRLSTESDAEHDNVSNGELSKQVASTVRSSDRDDLNRFGREDSGRDRSDRAPAFNDKNPPKPSKVLGVFGLSIFTSERDLVALFGQYGQVERCTVVVDMRTNRSRGFGFITMSSIESAAKAKQELTGYKLNERCMRVDYSYTHEPHGKTPGVYMGAPLDRSRDSRSRDRFHDGDRRREMYRNPVPPMHMPYELPPPPFPLQRLPPPLPPRHYERDDRDRYHRESYHGDRDRRDEHGRDRRDVHDRKSMSRRRSVSPPPNSSRSRKDVPQDGSRDRSDREMYERSRNVPRDIRELRDLREIGRERFGRR